MGAARRSRSTSRSSGAEEAMAQDRRRAASRNHAPIKCGESIMTNTVRRNLLACLIITAALGLSQAAQAAGYDPVTQQAQSKLKSLGLDPGPLDGVAGGATRTAVQAFQKQSGIPETGALDAATLDKLGIGTADKANAVMDWIPAPTQDDLDKLTANPINDPGSPYTD